MGDSFKRQAPGLPPNNCEAWTPVSAAKRSDRDGNPLEDASISTRSTRCMGKNTAPRVKSSPERVMATQSSNETSSHPRRPIPAPESERIAPQNFSRGADNVTKTTAPGRKGPAAASEFDTRISQRRLFTHGIISALVAGRTQPSIHEEISSALARRNDTRADGPREKARGPLLDSNRNYLTRLVGPERSRTSRRGLAIDDRKDGPPVEERNPPVELTGAAPGTSTAKRSAQRAKCRSGGVGK